MPKLTCVEETLDISSPASESKVEVRIVKGLKLAIKSNSTSDAKHLKWSYKTPDGALAVSYDQSRSDWEAKWRREVGQGRLEITQHVPGNKWCVVEVCDCCVVGCIHPRYGFPRTVMRCLHLDKCTTPSIPCRFLVPNPVVKLSTALLGGRDRIYAQWDFLERLGKLGDVMYFDVQGAKCKLTATAHSTGALQYGARVKIARGIVHSAAAEYHSVKGAEYTLKSRPMDKVKVKAVVKPGAQLYLESKVQPTFVARYAFVVCLACREHMLVCSPPHEWHAQNTAICR